MDLPSSDATVPDQQQISGLWEALQRATRRERPPSQLLSEFKNGVTDVVSESVNKYDLLCPRKQCGSIILKKGVGTLVEKPSMQVGVISPLIRWLLAS
jgi:guanine nucleotide exchange factor